MRLPTLQEAVFVRRLNRFAAAVVVDGRETTAHVANSGRLGELLRPGARCCLTPQPAAHRKTAFDVTLVAADDTVASPLVAVDARLPNALVWEAWSHGALAQFAEYTGARREASFGSSRLDLELSAPDGRRCYVEVKSVTLVEDGVALFPDAPTERGRRHLWALARAVAEGHRAAVVFAVQRGDACAFAPHDANDPAFGAALRTAVDVGVEAYAYTCDVSAACVRLAGAIPVRLQERP